MGRRCEGSAFPKAVSGAKSALSRNRSGTIFQKLVYNTTAVVINKGAVVLKSSIERMLVPLKLFYTYVHTIIINVLVQLYGIFLVK